MLNSQRDEELKALEEILARKMARNNLTDFSRYVWETEPARHHRVLNQKLDKLIETPRSRLIVCAPPGSAKSHYCSKVLPSYIVGKANNKLGTQLISCSNTANLAEGFGRAIRDKISSQRFKNVFPEAILDTSNSSSGSWGTTNHATYFSIGVGGTITGKRADYLILDDLLKGREEAESPTQRQKVFEWFLDDAMTRLKPTGSVIMIATRWHEDDPIGRLLEMDKKRGKPLWEVVSFEAICEHPENDPLNRKVGEALWPEWQTIDDLNRIREDYALNKNMRSWYSLYQQKPTPVEGNMVGRSWFKRYDLEKKLKDKKWLDSLRIIQSWDTATTGDPKNDPSVCVTIGITPERDYYLLSCESHHAEYPELERLLYRLARNWSFKQFFKAEEWPAKAVLVEDTNHGRSLLQSHKSRAPFDLIAVPAKKKGGSDKEIKFSSCTTIFEAGRFYVPDGLEWAEEYIEELISFPGSKRDDRVDATSNLLNWADRYRGQRGMSRVST